MDLKLLFENTFLINLVFLAVIIPTFTLSLSILKQTINKTKDKIAKDESEMADKFADEAMQFEKEAQNYGRFYYSQKVKSWFKKIHYVTIKHRKKSHTLIKRYKMLSIQGGVLTPGFFFLCSLFFSTIGKVYISSTIAFKIWLISLLFLILGLYRIYIILKLIQEEILNSENNE